MKTKTPLLTKISYGTAIALAGFSGAVATYGLCKLVPGGELVVAGMGVLFEAGKLTSFALLHRPLPRLLKGALLAVGCTLMVANVAGVSGFLSPAYERSQIHASASTRTNEATAHAAASLVERQLNAAEQNLAAANAALIHARDNKGRVKAAQAIVASATAERDALVRQLGTAKQLSAQTEGSAIEAGGEIAAIRFIAQATGTESDKVAHVAIGAISAIPDILAVLLLLASGYAPAKAPAVVRKPRRQVARKRAAFTKHMKVVPDVQQAA
jgi:hypothetical protein